VPQGLVPSALFHGLHVDKDRVSGALGDTRRREECDDEDGFDHLSLPKAIGRLQSIGCDSWQDGGRAFIDCGRPARERGKVS